MTDATQERVAWRYWRVSHWIASRLYLLGVLASYGTECGGGRSGWRLNYFHWFGKPVYILGVRRWWWASLPLCLRRGHLPYGPVAIGICGKCAPWPCCGSHTFDHAPGCKDEW